MKHNRSGLLCVLAVSIPLCAAVAANALTANAAYDPLAVPAGFTPETVDLMVKDAERKREIPIRALLPAEKAPVPLLLFSHGLGGSREGSSYLGRHWAGRGYVAVFLQHPGSDTSVWEGKPLNLRMRALEEAAGDWNIAIARDFWLSETGWTHPTGGPCFTAGLCWGAKVIDAVGWWVLPGSL